MKILLYYNKVTKYEYVNTFNAYNKYKCYMYKLKFNTGNFDLVQNADITPAI